MKNNIRPFFLILFTLFIPVNNFSQDFKPLQDGIEYAELTRRIDKLPVRMNLLRLDLTKVRLDVIHAMDKAIGVETVSAMAQKHKAFAAINAGFFRLDKSEFAGDAAGIFQIDGRLLSESLNDRIAALITNGEKSTEVAFRHLKTSVSLGYGVDSEIGISGINRERGAGEVIVYTPEFGPTTKTKDGGAEIVMKTECGPKNGPEECKGKVISINEEKGNSAIPAGGMVVSIDSGLKEFAHHVSGVKSFSKGKWFFLLPFYVVAPGNSAIFQNSLRAEDIVAGVPQLIKNGKIEITWEQEKSSKSFVETKHPRTAVAKLKDGKFLMITVDGRSESSGGISLNDLAALLLEFGATDGMNLDGGGSTTMFVDGKVVNHPSDKDGERKVSDALLVFPRKR
ncbi:MAG TPA: phosphodiester glycosidase family protein [Pyrinomonadaceae bacterium]|jgi:hypothetical protein|nr:phosphodiester glycosidase family protein [Pyrinomonadaceae bacterium]